LDSKETVRGFIKSTFLFGAPDAKLNDGDSFLETGMIDSTGILELVAFVEDQFGIEVADTELVPENLDSVEKLVAFIERKKVAAAS
jgi:acyl carrier protein